MIVPVYLINLDGSDDRLRSAKAQLDVAGITFQRVPAFDGRKLRIDEFPDYDAKAAFAYMGRPMQGGEIGCYLSHLECARRFLETDAPHALVLEDDMQLTPGFTQSLNEILSWLSGSSQAWYLVNLGPNKHKIYTPLQEFKTAGASYLLTHAHYFPMSTTALIWSRQGAQAFLASHQKIFSPVDNYFRHWQTRADRGLAVWPALVTTTGVESEIAPSSLPKRANKGRHRFYGLIKQRRLLVNKLIAQYHKLRAQTSK